MWQGPAIILNPMGMVLVKVKPSRVLPRQTLLLLVHCVSRTKETHRLLLKELLFDRQLLEPLLGTPFLLPQRPN